MHVVMKPTTHTQHTTHTHSVVTHLVVLTNDNTIRPDVSANGWSRQREEGRGERGREKSGRWGGQNELEEGGGGGKGGA